VGKEKTMLGTSVTQRGEQKATEFAYSRFFVARDPRRKYFDKAILNAISAGRARYDFCSRGKKKQRKNIKNSNKK
jgi:hypothetical protein